MTEKENLVEKAGRLLRAIHPLFEATNTNPEKCSDNKKIYYGTKKGYSNCIVCYPEQLEEKDKCFKKCAKCCFMKKPEPLKITINQDDIVVYEGLIKDLQTSFLCLNPRENIILRMRFGLFGWCKHNLEQCGKSFTVTRERIRQIEIYGLRKLAKNPLIIHLFKYLKKEDE